MDPAHNNSPDESALPNVPPQPEAGADALAMPPAESLESTAAGPQVASAPTAPPPMDGAAGGATASWLPPTVPVGQSGSDSSQGSQGDGASVQAPAIADDGDVIEREWVDKAKAIVARTHHDPYNQARELNTFKAEYLRKRYNKTIETVEE